MAFGPAAGLEIVDRLVDDAALRRYHLLPSVRADLLARLGRLDEARTEFERAAAPTPNMRAQTLLRQRPAPRAKLSARFTVPSGRVTALQCRRHERAAPPDSPPNAL